MYSTLFQRKTLFNILSDPTYAAQILDIVKPEYFSTDALKWIVEKTLWYHAQYRKAPSSAILKDLAVKELKEVDEVVFGQAVKEADAVWDNVNDPDLDYVRDDFLAFCKNKEMERAILESTRVLQNKDLGDARFDKIRGLVDGAMQAGMLNDVGLSYGEDFDVRYNESARKPVPLPWPIINNLTGGGAAPGEMFVIVGPGGSGKSYLLCDVGAHAFQNGLLVAHYTLELSDTYTSYRYDTMNTHISSYDLKERESDVKQMLSEIREQGGEIVIQQFPTKGATVDNIRRHFSLIESIKGRRPDIIILDYGDLLISNIGGNNSYEESGNIYMEVRGLAVELGVPIITASQSNRESDGEEVVTARHIAESYKKIAISDFIMSIGKTPSDKRQGLANYHVIKNRFGPDGRTYRGTMDTEYGIISIQGTDTGLIKPSSQNILGAALKNAKDATASLGNVNLPKM